MNGSSNAKSQWSVRPYREGDEDQIIDLRNTVMSVSKDRQWWQWMCRNGPNGPAIIWVADTGKQIIGHHALLPLRAIIGDEVKKCCIGFDAMTHPDYQRQGVLKSVDEKLSESAIKNGINFSFGLSEENTFPIYAKLGSAAICRPPLLVRVIKWDKVLKHRLRVPAFAGKLFGYACERLTSRSSIPKDTDIEVEQIQSFDESFDDFWQKASKIAPIMMIKDRKYLNWRYAEKPENEYKIFIARKHQKIAGYIVVVLAGGELLRGDIIDILTVPGEDMVTKALVTQAVSHLSKEGADMITCLVLPDSPYYQIMRKMGFMRRSSGLMFGSRIRNPELPRELIVNRQNWHYVRGDCDIV